MPKKTRKLPPPDKGDTISIYFHADVRAKILEIPPRSRGQVINAALRDAFGLKPPEHAGYAALRQFVNTGKVEPQ